MKNEIRKIGYASKHWKARVNIPHLQPLTITKAMLKKSFRIIDVRNNMGDAVRIKVENKKNKDGWKLEITTAKL